MKFSWEYLRMLGFAQQSYKKIVNKRLFVFAFLQILKLARLKGGIEFQRCALYAIAVDGGDGVVGGRGEPTPSPSQNEGRRNVTWAPIPSALDSYYLIYIIRVLCIYGVGATAIKDV